mgnify:CR=1 FL=1
MKLQNRLKYSYKHQPLCKKKISQLYGIRARHPTCCCPSIAAAAAADASIAKQGHNSCLYVENSKVSPGTTVQYV